MKVKAFTWIALYGCHHQSLRNRKNPKAGQWKHQAQFDITNHELPTSVRNVLKMVQKVFLHFATKPEVFCFEQSQYYL